MLFWTDHAMPVIALGYATHVLSDWITHRQDVGDPLLMVTGKTWGVDWYRTRYFWTEWAGLVLVLVITNVGATNIIIRHVIDAIPC
jgi:hypothetical protein